MWVSFAAQTKTPRVGKRNFSRIVLTSFGNNFAPEARSKGKKQNKDEEYSKEGKMRENKKNKYKNI